MIKWQVEYLTKWQHDYSMSWQVDKMTSNLVRIEQKWKVFVKRLELWISNQQTTKWCCRQIMMCWIMRQNWTQVNLVSHSMKRKSSTILDFKRVNVVISFVNKQSQWYSLWNSFIDWKKHVNENKERKSNSNNWISYFWNCFLFFDGFQLFFLSWLSQ